MRRLRHSILAVAGLAVGTVPVAGQEVDKLASAQEIAAFKARPCPPGAVTISDTQIRETSGQSNPAHYWTRVLRTYAPGPSLEEMRKTWREVREEVRQKGVLTSEVRASLDALERDPSVLARCTGLSLPEGAGPDAPEDEPAAKEVKGPTVPEMTTALEQGRLELTLPLVDDGQPLLEAAGDALLARLANAMNAIPEGTYELFVIAHPNQKLAGDGVVADRIGDSISERLGVEHGAPIERYVLPDRLPAGVRRPPPPAAPGRVTVLVLRRNK